MGNQLLLTTSILLPWYQEPGNSKYEGLRGRGWIVWEQARTLYSPCFIYPGSNPLPHFWGSCRLTDLAFNQWPISTAWFKRAVLKSAFILLAKTSPWKNPNARMSPSFSSIEGNLSDRILQLASDQQEREVLLKSDKSSGICGSQGQLSTGRQLFQPAPLAAWSFSETLHGNYAEEIIWSSAN